MTAVTSDPTRDIDLLALGDPVLDVVVHGSGLPVWDDKRLGRSAQLRAGGTEANAACAASQLGLRVALFGSQGSGPDAALLRAALLRAGVGLQHLRSVPGAASAMAIVFVSDSGERAITYIPAPPGADRQAELRTLLAQARWLYTLPYDWAAFGQLAQSARAAGTRVAVDVESANGALPGAQAALRAAGDLLFFNEAGFERTVGTPARLEAAAEWIRCSSAHTLVVSLGAGGALAVDREGGAALQPAYPARVVDTTGAGDTFNAAFLAARLHGADLRAALRQACAAACLCVETMGARVDTLSIASVQALQDSRAMP